MELQLFLHIHSLYHKIHSRLLPGKLPSGLGPDIGRLLLCVGKVWTIQVIHTTALGGLVCKLTEFVKEFRKYQCI